MVDVTTEGERWHEAFLRPSQVGGLVVQLAWQGGSDEDWRRAAGMSEVDAADDAAVLVGALLRHPDLDEIRRVWTALGAQVVPHEDGPDAAVRVRWDGAPLDLEVRRGEQPGAVAVRFAGTGPLPPDPVAGAAVITG